MEELLNYHLLQKQVANSFSSLERTTTCSKQQRKPKEQVMAHYLLKSVLMHLMQGCFNVRNILEKKLEKSFNSNCYHHNHKFIIKIQIMNLRISFSM